ncbi:MAG: threonine/serine exporter family protein, partial [Terrimicrobiaceae bacterium]
MSDTPEEPVERGESVEATRAVHLCLLLGRILFSFGATAERIQDSIACLARYLGFKVDALVSYEALLITVSEGETFRTRVDSRRAFAGLNLLGLLRVSQTLRGLLRSKPSPE